MKKTILNKDIELNITTKTAGKEGIILLKQDEVGGHVVTLGEGNVGEINVDLTPNVTTELTYRIDDELVYWTSKVLNPAIPTVAPSAINDLQIEYVNTTDVKIKWSAPVSDPNRPNQKASSYTLVCSEVMLTEQMTSIMMMQMQKTKLKLVPKPSGEEEIYVIKNLLAGKRYYLNVISENSIRGKLLYSPPSNIEVFFTPYDSKDATSTPSIIPLRDTHGRVYTYFTQPFSENPSDPLNENNFQITGRRLADQTGWTNVDGEPDGYPENYGYVTNWAMNTGEAPPTFVPEFYGFMSGSWGNPFNQGWYNFDNPWIMFDLDGAWDITSIWIYVNTEMVAAQGYNIAIDARKFDFKGSVDGTNWVTIGSINVSYGVQGWTKIDVLTHLAKEMKFFVVGASSYHLGAIGVYGVRSASYTISGHKLKRETPQRSIKEKIGVNAFLGENDIDKMASLSDVTRWYNNANWFINSPRCDKRLEDHPDLSVDDVEYKFVDTLDDWNSVDQLTTFKDAGVTNMICINNTIAYNTSSSDIVSQGEAWEAIPLDPNVQRGEILESTNPNNYKHFARLWYTLAAKLGNNPDADPTFIKIKSTEDQTLGLNLVNYGECNNERDSIWIQSRFMNAEENAALQSACYDGHNNTMGGGFGVKNADPEFNFLTSGTIGPETGYIFRMMKWWDYNRGQGNYPLDVISYHNYIAFSDLPDTYASANSWGSRPERKQHFDFKRGKMWQYAVFRDMYMPNKELWCTETGYSEHFGGSCAPNYPTQVERSFYKAAWTLRLLILKMYIGVDVINLFWYSNHGETRLEDANQTIKNKSAFATHGLTDGITWTNDWNRKYLPTGWYLATFRNEIEGYHLRHSIKTGLVEGTMDEVISTVDPTLYAFAVENPDTNETGILAWYSDMQMAKKAMRILLDPTEIDVDVVTFEGADVRQDLQGVSTNIPASVEAGVRYIDIQVGEVPVFIKTKNIGIEKLKAVDEIRIQSVSQSAIKLTWLDINVGNTHKTKIFMSTSVNEGYTLITNDIITNGEYVASGLATSTNYFFRIQLEDGAKQSDVSATYGASTLYQIATPSDFSSNYQTTSAITLNWTYSEDDQEKIDKFLLYRSSSLSGAYAQIATISKSARSFVNSGLLTDVGYYYKLVAVKGVNQYSQPTFFDVKTTQNEGIAPIALALKSNYVGDKVFIRFDREVKNVANNEVAFTVRKITTSPIYTDFFIPITETLVDNSDKSLVTIRLTEKIPNDVELYVSYDDSLGSILDKDTDTPLLSFELEAENNSNSPLLLSKKVNINFINGGSGDDIVTSPETWNNLTFNFESGNNQYQGGLVDKNNVNTNWRFLLPFSDYPVFINKWDSEYLPAHTFDSLPADVTNLFPASSLTSGNMLASWASRAGVKISGLDNTKEYNLYFSVVPMTYEALPEADFNVESLNGLHSTTWKVSKSQMKLGALYGLKPNVGSFTNIGVTAKEYNGSTFDAAVSLSEGINDISLLFTNQTSSFILIITGMAIEEVIPLVI